MNFNVEGLNNHDIAQQFFNNNLNQEEFSFVRQVTKEMALAVGLEELKEQVPWDRFTPDQQLQTQKLLEVCSQEVVSGIYGQERDIDRLVKRIQEHTVNAANELAISEQEASPAKGYLRKQHQAQIEQKVKAMNIQVRMKAKTGIKSTLETVDKVHAALAIAFDPSIIDHVRNRVLEAKKYNYHPKELSSEKLADLKMKALIEEEEKAKKKPAAKKTKSSHSPHPVQQNQKGKKTEKQKKAIQLSSNPQKTEKSAEKNAPSIEKKEILTSAQTAQMGLNFFKNPRGQQLSRVTRWSTESVCEIRQFSDIDPSGEQIWRYRELSEEEVLIQRAYHYLPGTERLLTRPDFRDTYAFPTERGYGMVAQLSLNNKDQQGLLYIGIDKTNTVFHQYFEIRNFQNENIFIEQEREESVYKEKDKIEEWMSKNDPFTLDVSESGVLQFTYSKNHAIKIFPLFPERLPNIARKDQ